jgi:hypothetical protein
VLRPTCSATYAPAKSRPCSPNAPGSAAAITRLASITAVSTARMLGEPGSNQLTIQIV